MPSETEATSPEPDGLQFDHAEFENDETSSAVACSACHREIVDHYYEINGTIFCESCRSLIESHFKGGSAFVRLLKAVVLGSGASVASAAIYFAVLHFLHIQAALVSILCGFLVGKAVRKGSDGRGGWIYQILAILLTYLAIGMAYTAVAVAGGAFNAAPNQPAPAAGQDAIPIIARMIGFSVLTIIAPVLVAKEDLISLVIVVFALWEAWKFTKAAKLIITGPYRIGDAEPEPGIEEVPGHA